MSKVELVIESDRPIKVTIKNSNKVEDVLKKLLSNVKASYKVEGETYEN